MRTLLGRAAATTVAGCAMLISASVAMPTWAVNPVHASSAPDATTVGSDDVAPTPEAEPVTTTTTPTTTTTTTTTPPVPLIVQVPNPAAVTPTRGTAVQVAPTQPPPPTTTTTTLPPEHLLPANSGSGRRVVYRKSWPMRVWLVEGNGAVAKTHLVSGRATWNQPKIGTYSVFSRSGYTCNINNPHVCWRYMVRFTKGPDGDNIGFHEIPTNTKTGYKLQSESQLGLALSNGCVRQATSDAIWTWNFAGIGTQVVVLP